MRARGLSVVHRTAAGEVVALADASLSLRAGEFVVLVGPSGAGKTTLLHALGGLQAPTSGTVHIGDTDLSRAPAKVLERIHRDHVGFVFQSFGLIGALSARENIELPLRIRGTDPSERERTVVELLDRVGLTDHAEQRPDELSGGQQQRVGIARAIASRPRILLADEPTGQLDSRTAEAMIDLLARIAHEERIAVLLTTHDAAVVHRADRVREMHDGVLRDPDTED